jgi:hypothetical protein
MRSLQTQPPLYRLVCRCVVVLIAVRLLVPTGYMLSVTPSGKTEVAHCHSQSFGKGSQILKKLGQSQKSLPASSSKSGKKSHKKDCGYRSVLIPLGCSVAISYHLTYTSNSYSVPVLYDSLIRSYDSPLTSGARAPPLAQRSTHRTV